MEYEFWVGSYGTGEQETIAKFSLDGRTGQITKRYGYDGVENPSWVGLNKTKTILYAVEELKPEGRLRAFAIEEQGLVPKACLSTKGADPCHICLDQEERYLFAANYSSGSLAEYRLDESGIPRVISSFLQDKGTGPNPARQEGPHVHFAKALGDRIFVVDLGTDLVSVYHLNGETGRLKNTGKALGLPAGAGPRHLAFHPDMPGLVYVACELGSSLAVFREKEDKFALEAMESTLPESFSGENTVAAIRIYGNRLFVSNRGHDSIAVFSVQGDGGLALDQIIPTGGKGPRDFAMMGEYIVIANQGSHEITVLQFRWETGKLEQTGISVPMSCPSCICPVLE